MRDDSTGRSGRHLRAAATVALLGGALVGGAIGLLLTSGEHIHLLLASRIARLGFVALTAATGTIACATALCPIALLVGWLDGRRAAGVDPVRTYSVILVVGLAALHAFLTIGFVVVPEIATTWLDPTYDGPLRHESFRNGNVYDRLETADLAYLEALYDGALTHVDAEVGRLIEALGLASPESEALVIVTSDHGEEFWDHGGTSHGYHLYEEQLRIPLMLRPPAGATVRTTRHPARVASIDVAPTVLDYLGLPALPIFEGRSLRPLVEGAPGEPGRTLFAEAALLYNERANVRSLYRYAGDTLYRLDTDPKETRNLSSLQDGVRIDLENRLVEHAALSASGPSERLDAETIERLRSLGYVQ